VIQRLGEACFLYEQPLQNAGFEISEPLYSESNTNDLDAYRLVTVSYAGQSFAILGITQPDFSPQSPAFVGLLARRARARKVEYIILSNQRETLIQTTPRRDGEIGTVIRRYAPVQILSSSVEPLSPTERLALTSVAEKISSDLHTLSQDGRLDLIQPDADYFVDRLTRAVATLKPTVKSALITQFSIAPQFADEVITWATKQGIPAEVRSPDFSEAVVRQAIYRLLGKIIFYQSLRRAIPSLPEMVVDNLDTSQVITRLSECFAEAHKIDYHAVFREDIVDRLPFPSEASAELRDLVGMLNTRDFAHLPQDVVGAVFERLIPPEDRHALGQFFTPENLVDLIIAFCLRYADDAVMDPTCGTGTFLIRAYDRKRSVLGLHDHSQQLSQLWGIDVAPFPAELATINLFRQQVGTMDNFPRIINDDFFNIIPGGKYRFPPLKSGLEDLVEFNQMVTIPQFDAIVGNFPYISADRIEQREKGYSEKIARRLATEWFEIYPDGFTFKSKEDERQHRSIRERGPENLTAFTSKAKPRISTYADLYVSLFWHAAAFLKPGGRMGIVTSNAWLDVGYGLALQRFFLDNFKIIAILESRCEPWFEQAAVNTVVTILERCVSQVERDAYPMHFVKIKRPLAELMPWDIQLDGLRRWVGTDKLIQSITSITKDSEDPTSPHTVEDNNLRIRTLNQGALRAQAEVKEQTGKWGRFLRAPQVYFELLKQAGNKLTLLGEVAPPARGSLTGINAFYHLNNEQIGQLKIESEFLFPLLKSGSSTVNRGHGPHLAIKVFSARESLPRCFGGRQPGGGIRNRSSSLTVQI
jgi:type I restriction enzyme M protein